MDVHEALFTRTEYELLPEGFPAQLIGGLLVRQTAPRYGHQRLGVRIRARLLALCDPDLVPDPPVDVLIDDLNVFQPDVVVLRERPEDDAPYVGIPRLALEILSPATATRDRKVKKAALLAAGVGEVWLVDPRRAEIEVHTRTGAEVFNGERAATSAVVPGFALVPATLFPR